MSRSIPISVLFFVCACGESALDVTLVPDPQLNSVDELVARVDRMELVVDSVDSALYPPGSERVGENFEIKDHDGDPSDLELVSSIDIVDRLPTILVNRGTIPDARIEFTLRGFDSAGGIVATGGMSGAEFRDEIVPVALPFDLVPSARPLRVAEVIPDETVMAPHCQVSMIVVIFSREVDRDSVLAAGAVRIFPGTVQTVSVSASAPRFAQIVPSTIAGDGMFVSFRLLITPTVTDPDGNPLDENASEPGPQAFDRMFRVPCGPGSKAPTMLGCDQAPMSGECPSDDLVCGAEGVCLPVCASGVVCPDRTWCAPDGSCGSDCRAAPPDSDPCSGLRCDPATGACI
jgi:hypothetical protein